MPCEELQEVPQKQRRPMPYVDWSLHPRHMTFYFDSGDRDVAERFARFYHERDGQWYDLALEGRHWVVRFMRPPLQFA